MEAKDGFPAPPAKERATDVGSAGNIEGVIAGTVSTAAPLGRQTAGEAFESVFASSEGELPFPKDREPIFGRGALEWSLMVIMAARGGTVLRKEEDMERLRDRDAVCFAAKVAFNFLLHVIKHLFAAVVRKLEYVPRFAVDQGESSAIRRKPRINCRGSNYVIENRKHSPRK